MQRARVLAVAAAGGQGLAEYALILALISIVAIVALLLLGGGLNTILSVAGTGI
jgi:Flp pilus assembly pilin Flp